MLLQRQDASAGQDLPGGAAGPATTASEPTPAQSMSGGPNAAQFASKTLASLLSAQEAPPSSADTAAKIIKTADTNGDGSLSLDEIKTAVGGNSAAADQFSQAFAKLDANGDGTLSASELTSALDAKKGAHHAHHARPSSADVASKVVGEADTNGDGALSADEIQTVLGANGSSGGSADSLTQAIAKLDTNGDGKLNAAELSAALDAFRAAHQRGGEATPPASAVTA